MLSVKQIIINGFAIFSMFFGSGNLIFPLQIGQMAAENWLFACIGLMTSGVILPFLGFFIISKFEGNYHKFFGTAGKTAQIFLPFICLSLLGPFGVVPRCITVSLGSFLSIVPTFPHFVFNTILSIILLLFCLYREQIIPLLGKILTPILLFSLGIFIIIGLYQIKIPFAYNSQKAISFLEDGFVTGYQTMDLIAAFFFSSKIYLQLKAQSNLADLNQTNLKKYLIYSGIIGALCLGIIYLCFIVISASLSRVNQGIPNQELLNVSAIHILGPYANLILCIAIILSCLTTAIALNSIYAEYLTVNVFKNRFTYSQVLLVTCIIALIISNYDFNGIARLLGPVLEVIYPSLIIMTLMSLLNFQNYRFIKIAFYSTLIINVIYNYP